MLGEIFNALSYFVGGLAVLAGSAAAAPLAGVGFGVAGK